MANVWVKPGRPPKHKNARRFEVNCDMQDLRMLDEQLTKYPKISRSEFVVRAIKSLAANQYFDNEHNQKIINHLKKAVIKLTKFKEKLKETEQELEEIKEENSNNKNNVDVLKRYIKLKEYATSTEYEEFIQENKETLKELNILSAEDKNIINKEIEQKQEEENQKDEWQKIRERNYVTSAITQLQELKEKEKTKGLTEPELISKKLQLDTIKQYGTTEEIQQFC
ncbi:tRNA nucleotidyltransferase/poly(A) polymerase [Methanococcus voltae]|uniref:tRNA nucleotidyltransferase/poly(A) polymerase n=1 Tax=Methanococcus voltae TaxID=2188 RepID=A0A8J7S676_METVO|nr:hypothetical protein [Methanococcus voltae]MBP2202158.1 tRNA nucleotidyltransferase/poly(A) polymerase [Methanococcus voltae]